MTVLVFLDPAHPHGRVVDAAMPQLMATDLGATRGDGIFESLLVVNGTPRKLQAHLDRFNVSAQMVRLKVPDQRSWRRAIDTALTQFFAEAAASASGQETDLDSAPEPETEMGGRSAASAASEVVLKLVATRGVEGASAATCWVSAFPPPATAREQRRTGLDILLLDRGYDSRIAERSPWLLQGAKTLSYAVNMAAVRYAREQGADDAIFTSSDGKVLEGPTSTVLVARVENGIKHLLTPERESGILPGTTQDALFAAAGSAGWQLGYGPLEPADLLAADGVWLVSSVRRLAPVNSIDGVTIARSAELTAELNLLIENIV